MLIDDGRSHNGSFVNGQRVGDRHRLEDGDILRFGETLILYRAPPPSGMHPRLAAGSTREQDRHGGRLAGRGVPLRGAATGAGRPLQTCGRQMQPTSGAAADQELAKELALNVEAVRENLWALSHVFDAEELPEDERVAQIVERAARAAGSTPRHGAGLTEIG